MFFSIFLVICVQACLVQNTFGQCIRPYTPAASLAAPMSSNVALDMISSPFVAPLTTPMTDSFLVQAAADAYTAYGGAGIGEAAVDGQIPALGSTAVAGQVPILGGVEFGGIVPAAGTITIAGTCGCGAFIY